jgi:hypothetical protein
MIKPYLDPQDDAMENSIDPHQVVTIGDIPMPTPKSNDKGRVYIDLSDILNTLIPEKSEIAYELVLRWKVRAEDVSDVDEAQLINELNNWGDLHIISIEETTV